MLAFLRRDWPTAALVVLAAIFILPLWSVQIPAMPDYPAHLAGFHLINGATKSGPLSEFYVIHWLLLPNLASEILVPLLSLVFPLEAAVKVFLSIAVLMWVIGAALIQKALTGKIGPAPLAGALFATNANFTWGFLNYTFASGLAFLIFAAWIATRHRRNWAMLAGFAVAVFALYVCHLFAVCTLLVLIGVFELVAAVDEHRPDPGLLLRRILQVSAAALPAAARLAKSPDVTKQAAREQWRKFGLLSLRLLKVAAIFVPAAAAFVFFKSAGGEGGGVEFNYADTIGDRFGSAAQWSFSDPAYLVIGGLAILILAGLAYDKIRIHPALKLLVLAMATLTLIAPEWALGGWGVDMRLPPVLGVITFASLELRMDRRLAAAFGALIVLVAGTNAAILTADWQQHDKQYREFRAAIRSIPEGSKIFTVLDGDALDDINDPPYWHMAELAIVDRAAFTPLMFTTKGQHVVQLRSPFDRLAAANAKQGSPPDATELSDLALGRTENDPDIDENYPYLKYFQCHFDYAVVVHGGGEQADVPAFLSPVHSGSFFKIYAIHPTGLCASR